MEPAERAVTKPVDETDATAGLLLDQLPPVVPPLLLNVDDAPTHNDAVPVTTLATTFELTVNVRKELAPLTVYMILEMPALIAATKPVVLLTVATAVFDEVQEPPPSPLLEYVAVAPMQRGVVPLIVPALVGAFTVNAWNDETGLPHPLFIEYVMLTVP